MYVVLKWWKMAELTTVCICNTKGFAACMYPLRPTVIIHRLPSHFFYSLRFILFHLRKRKTSSSFVVISSKKTNYSRTFIRWGRNGQRKGMKYFHHHHRHYLLQTTKYTTTRDPSFFLPRLVAIRALLNEHIIDAVNFLLWWWRTTTTTTYWFDTCYKGLL